MKSTGSMEMSRTQVALITVSQGIFAMSLSPKNCVTLRSMNSQLEDAQETKVTESKVTKDSPFGKIIGKRRHSTTPAPVMRETVTRPRPRNAKSLTEIPNTEIIDGLFTTTLCSTEL